MRERIRFIHEWEKGDLTMAGVCRKYGVSRPTGYKWIQRYLELEGDLTAPSRSRLRYAPGSSSNCAIVWRHSAGIGTGLKSDPTKTRAALDVTSTSSAARTS